MAGDLVPTLEFAAPDASNRTTVVSPTVTTGSVTFGGNVLGNGNTTPANNILLYGAIGLALIFFLKDE